MNRIMEEAKRRGRLAMKSDGREVLLGGLTLEGQSASTLPKGYNGF